MLIKICLSALVIVFLICDPSLVTAQSYPQNDSARQQYLQQIKIVSRSFSGYFYPNRDRIYGLPEKAFVFQIDSLRKTFTDLLDRYNKDRTIADPLFSWTQQKEIHYFFDKFILDYPFFHELATNSKTRLTVATQKRLDNNLIDFNDTSLLKNPDFKEYVRGFLHHHTQDEMKKTMYKKMDNQRLNSILNVINQYISDKTCLNFWRYDFIYAHMDDFGVKNMASVMAMFNAACHDTSYTNALNRMYDAGMKARLGHLIKTYKTVNGFPLEIHLFLPDSIRSGTRSKMPVFVFFSGGSWTLGNPEWAFGACADYAKKGWVGVSVEYRIADRQNTTPFEAVKDARSAIRWLRQHSNDYGIDTNRIVASGNSAGAHLVLTTALSDEWNEKTDDLHFSASPNLLLINSGVYDMVGDGNTSWVSKGLKDKTVVKKISPLHLVREGLPPMLMLHGTNDHSVPYETAKAFADEMKKTGNDFEFHTLQGAPHEIWFDRRFTESVGELRKAFLKKHGYE